MSKIIMNASLKDDEFMHQVQTSNGEFYWVHTVHVSQPLGNGYETIAVRCRESGSVSKKAWRSAMTWRHGESFESAVAFHNTACEKLERIKES